MSTNLSDKYILKEDNYNINLYEIVDVRVKEDGEFTGEIVKKEKLVGHFSTSGMGRKQIYNRMINSEISNLEVQSLESILKVVEDTSKQILDWFEENK